MYDLKKFRKDNGLTQKNAASFFGVTQAFISQIELGDRPIPESFISKIKADPSMKMITDDTQAPYILGNAIERNNKERGVPYFDIDISATMAESFSDIAEAPEFYVDFKPFNDCTVYLPVFGESMYPVISSGEIVALKKIDNPEYIQYGEVHMIITNAESNNMRTLKIIRKHENEDMIILKPVNPSFDELVIPRRTIISLYIMKGKITRKQL